MHIPSILSRMRRKNKGYSKYEKMLEDSLRLIMVKRNKGVAIFLINNTKSHTHKM